MIFNVTHFSQLFIMWLVLVSVVFWLRCIKRFSTLNCFLKFYGSIEIGLYVNNDARIREVAYI